MYQDHDSFLHRLNPLSKLVATAPVVFFLALTMDPYTPAALVLACAAATVALGSVPPLAYLRLAAPLLVAVSGLVLLYPIAASSAATEGSPVILDLGLLELREAGLLLGFSIALKILSIFSLTLLFVLTTDPQDFVRALVQQWRLPYRVGYAALAAFRFVPRLGAELRVIRAAHRVRGVGEGGGIGGRYERLKRYSVPLLASAIRHAERVALAMDSRAFGAHDRRTYLRRLVFARRDWAFVGLFWVASLAMVLLLHRTGVLGPLGLSRPDQ